MTEALTYFLTVGLAMPDEAIARMRNTPDWAAVRGRAVLVGHGGALVEAALGEHEGGGP